MPDSKSVANHCYVVFGASGGIGACVARQLSQAGHSLVLAARASDRLDALAEELHSPRVEIDATKFDEVEKCYALAAEQFGSVCGAVNCVGSVLLKPAHLTSEQELLETLNTNLVSAFAVVRGAAKHLSEAGSSVVLVSSAAAQIGLANHEAIAAAKGGIEALSRSAAATYARKKLRVNAVAPGLVKTKLTERIWASERAAAHSQAMHALGRLGEPEDVASLICWLLAAENSWITGQVIGVDGGLGCLKT